MLISQAHAQESATPPATTAETAVPPMDAGAVTPPDTTSILIQNVGMIVLLMVMFYFLLIRPQQKRFKEHSAMISHLDKGTKVVTQGGLVGTIDKNVSDNEVVLDFGNNVKISMLRSYIIGRYDDTIIPPANDDSKNKKDTSTK